MYLSYNEDRPDSKTTVCWGCLFIITRRLLSRDGLCPRCQEVVAGHLTEDSHRG